MSRPAAEERIAQLQAQAQAQRLAAQLAIFEAKEQLAPLKSAAGVFGMAVRALSGGGTAGGTLARLAKFGIGHPWVSSTLGTLAWRLVRRRPIALLSAAAAGIAAWWLLRTPAGQGGSRPPANG
jgi:hypothetical protein